MNDGAPRLVTREGSLNAEILAVSAASIIDIDEFLAMSCFKCLQDFFTGITWPEACLLNAAFLGTSITSLHTRITIAGNLSIPSSSSKH